MEEYDPFVRPFPHCPQCVHYPNKIDEDGYHYCHMCVMEYDCFEERKGDSSFDIKPLIMGEPTVVEAEDGE